MKPIPCDKWKWFGNAAHLIVSRSCHFHMATQVGRHLVSTVGEYWPERSTREIIAKCADPEWLAENQHRKGDDFDAAYMRRFGYDTIGCDRKYETMVFKLRTGHCPCGCGLPNVDYTEIDFSPYNDAISATKGHMAMCKKISN